MATNHLDINDRIKLGKQNEHKVLMLLNKHRPVVCHTIWDKWVAASQAEDMQQKIDAWATSGLAKNPKSVQIKYRETGRDLGIAILRPYFDDQTLIQEYRDDVMPLDRDYVNPVDFYACLSGNTLMVVEGSKIKRGADLMLEQLVRHGGFMGYNGFKHANYGGAELRLVKDQGSGYSGGQNKIICYFTPGFINMAGGFVKDVL